jgi:hypothetical protein
VSKAFSTSVLLKIDADLQLIIKCACGMKHFVFT